MEVLLEQDMLEVERMEYEMSLEHETQDLDMLETKSHYKVPNLEKEHSAQVV